MSEQQQPSILSNLTVREKIEQYESLNANNWRR